MIQYLDSGTDVNGLDENGYSAIHAAASYNHVAVLDTLIQRGGNPNLEDFDGDTPLYVAETRDMVAHLVRHGAHVAHRNKEGKTALEHHIEEDEFPDVVAALQTLTPSTDLGTAGVASVGGHESVPFAAGVTAHYQATAVGGVNAASTAEEQNQETLEAMDGLPVEVRERIGQVMRQTEIDGINRDEELRGILHEALVGNGIFGDRNLRQRTE